MSKNPAKPNPSPSVKYHSLICRNCGEYHSEALCKSDAKSMMCHLCDAMGHSDAMCSNNWRLFHSVTSYDDLTNLKPAELKRNKICACCCSTTHRTVECPTIKKTVQTYRPVSKQKDVQKIRKRASDMWDAWQKQNHGQRTIETVVLDDESSEDKSTSQNESSAVSGQPSTSGTDLSNVQSSKQSSTFNLTNSNSSTSNQATSSNEVSSIGIGDVSRTSGQQILNKINSVIKNWKSAKRAANRKQNKNARMHTSPPNKQTRFDGQLIDKQIKSQAIKFNAITMKNVHHFVNRQPNSQFNHNRNRNQPSTSRGFHADQRSMNPTRKKMTQTALRKRERKIKFSNKRKANKREAQQAVIQ